MQLEPRELPNSPLPIQPNKGSFGSAQDDSGTGRPYDKQKHSSRAIDRPAMPNRILRLARELIHPTPVTPQEVISGRIEIERDGKVAYLEYSLGGNVLELIHTEVPKELRGMGLASALAERALKWAREKGYKVDVICPFVSEYISKHPEYADLVIQ
jgi:uncharacterized protein